MANPLYVKITQVNDEDAQAFIDMLSQKLQEENYDELHLIFEMSGKSAGDGLVVHNFLRTLPIKIIAYNDGTLNLAETMMFLAGEERYASPSSEGFVFDGTKTNQASIY